MVEITANHATPAGRRLAAPGQSGQPLGVVAPFVLPGDHDEGIVVRVGIQ